MIYTPKTIQALKLAYEKHQGQFDKSGIPYIFHPYHLAEQMDTEDACIVALLHDIIEDTDTTFEDLEKYNFGENVIESLKLLTHDKKIDYYEYINNLSSNTLAVKVKLADLKHNSDTSRLPKITPKDILRNKKYKKCIDFLENLNNNY